MVVDDDDTTGSGAAGASRKEEMRIKCICREKVGNCSDPQRRRR